MTILSFRKSIILTFLVMISFQAKAESSEEERYTELLDCFVEQFHDHLADNYVDPNDVLDKVQIMQDGGMIPIVNKVEETCEQKYSSLVDPNSDYFKATYNAWDNFLIEVLKKNQDLLK